nr:bifunctional UDP-sugar hydrolase/5'-nucleotidase [Tissierella sp.]
MKKKEQKFTILHSNDMHGDFMAETEEGSEKLIGGLGLLSGYINKVRAQEDNVIYTISGDMIQGSIIDSEYKGVSTMQLMNFLSPDVATLGNHEVDYGLPHLLFLEKVANFPIVNANLYIKHYGKRLMTPYKIINVGGFDIMFIGIITEMVMDKIALDKLIGTFVSIEDAAEEVGKICNAYKNHDIDLTVALTHIGFESDLKLAELLKPEWGVDMILGGHTHTVLDQPEIVNDIIIAQAGYGTDQIGRFDIVVDEKTNSISEWKWELVPINSETAEVDESLEEFLHGYKDRVDEKYNVIISRLSKKLTHPSREEETSLGNLFADALADVAQTDIMLLGSGSIRSNELGPVITLGSLKAGYPYEDSLIKYCVTGEQVKIIFNHIMQAENRNGEGEYFQVNKNIEAIYSESKKRLESLKVNNREVVNDKEYTLTIQGYHAANSKKNIGLDAEELKALGLGKVVSTSDYDVIEEWLRTHSNVNEEIEGRLVYRK